MVFMKSLVVALAFTSYLGNGEDFQNVYVRGLQCNFSEKYIYQNFSCFPKSWSRTISTMNVIMTLKKPIKENLYIEGKVFYKYGTIYREVIRFPRIEWCGMAKDYLEPKIPTPLSFAIATIKDSAPEAIHKCPYTELNVRNRTFVTNAMKSIFPRGQYKVILFGSDRKNEPIGAVNFILDVDSSHKETFG